VSGHRTGLGAGGLFHCGRRGHAGMRIRAGGVTDGGRTWGFERNGLLATVILSSRASSALDELRPREAGAVREAASISLD
jgi:hypothetical protein